jgi:uncharacterized damage-inducible protein DinB
MAQKTASEKDMFLQVFQKECQTTIRLMKAFPADKADLRPHERSKSAKELAWIFVQEQGLADMALKGRVDFTQSMPPVPANFTEILPAFENTSRETITKISSASEEDLNRTMPFPIGPGKMGEVRRLDVIWMTLHDQIHHRGQLSVYLRLAGGKVPSIYGPSADEPWM